MLAKNILPAQFLVVSCTFAGAWHLEGGANRYEMHQCDQLCLSIDLPGCAKNLPSTHTDVRCSPAVQFSSSETGCLGQAG